ncbi:MAG: hypothetical protein HOI96_07090 [Rhodospirillaceae bacterium]|nr:hypothetical protein [Rhodospirillaceae bacterium]
MPNSGEQYVPNPQYEHFKNFSSNGMSFGEKKQVWLGISDMTEAEFDAMMAEEKSREPSVPQVGEMAPDFTAERLGEGRSRTGEYVTLSQLKGRPVALAYGSFT